MQTQRRAPCLHHGTGAGAGGGDDGAHGAQVPPETPSSGDRCGRRGVFSVVAGTVTPVSQADSGTFLNRSRTEHQSPPECRGYYCCSYCPLSTPTPPAPSLPFRLLGPCGGVTPRVGIYQMNEDRCRSLTGTYKATTRETCVCREGTVSLEGQSEFSPDLPSGGHGDSLSCLPVKSRSGCPAEGARPGVGRRESAHQRPPPYPAACFPLILLDVG